MKDIRKGSESMLMRRMLGARTLNVSRNKLSTDFDGPRTIDLSLDKDQFKSINFLKKNN